MPVNTEALNNPNYNPTIDPDVISLMGLMSDPSNELLQQYRDVWNNLPTVNPFEGVIVNPHQCDIQDTKVNTGKIIDTLTGWGENNFPNDPTWNSGFTDPNNPDSIVSKITGGTQTLDPKTGLTNYTNNNGIDPSLDRMNDHTNKLLANLPMILGMVQQALGLATVIEGLLDPCMGTGSFLGSLMDQGKALMKKIKDKIDKVFDEINDFLQEIQRTVQEVLDFVNQAIQDAMDFAKEMVDMIEGEIEKLIKSLIDSLRANLSNFLKGLHIDTCLKGLFHNVTSMAASGAISQYV